MHAGPGSRSSSACACVAHRIRDLNDEINKCIREKGHWERRIVELGGPDYSKSAPAVTDSEGKEMAELSGVCRMQCVAWHGMHRHAHAYSLVTQGTCEDSLMNVSSSTSMRIPLASPTGKITRTTA